MYAVGAELQLKDRWTVRLEWAHFEQRPVVTSFSRTVTGVGVPFGTTADVVVATPMPRGMVSLLVSFRLGKG